MASLSEATIAELVRSRRHAIALNARLWVASRSKASLRSGNIDIVALAALESVIDL
jgi:hypothetical protein